MENKSDWMNDMIASRQQSDSKYSLQLETQDELQNFGKCNLVSGVDFEVFVFPISMHESLLNFDSQSNLYNYEYADLFSHNENEVEANSDICMHYETEGSYFVLPSVWFQYDDMIGETKEKENHSLPLMDVIENYVYDRGKYHL